MINMARAHEKFPDVALILRARIFLRFRNVCLKIATYRKNVAKQDNLAIHPIKFRI